MRGLVGVSAVLSLVACGNDFVSTSEGFDRVTALRRCVANGDAFDGLEVRIVPGPDQTAAGCVRLLFREGAQSPPRLDLSITGGLQLVEGERELRQSCALGQPPAPVVELREASGSGTLDGDRLDLEAELTFDDDATLRISPSSFNILGRDC